MLCCCIKPQGVYQVSDVKVVAGIEMTLTCRAAWLMPKISMGIAWRRLSCRSSFRSICTAFCSPAAHSDRC